MSSRRTYVLVCDGIYCTAQFFGLSSPPRAEEVRRLAREQGWDCYDPLVGTQLKRRDFCPRCAGYEKKMEP